VKEENMANYSRWDDVKTKRRVPTTETRAGVEQDLALGQLIYDLRTGARNRIDTLARVANALGRHLVVSFPEEVPARLKDAVQVA